MPYIVNTKKGTSIQHPDFGSLNDGVALRVTEHTANQVKHIKDVIVFDTVIGVDDKKIQEKTIPKEIDLFEDPIPTHLHTYNDFVSYYKDVTLAGKKWKQAKANKKKKML